MTTEAASAEAQLAGAQLLGNDQLSYVRRALATVDELAACRERNELLRVAIDVVRTRLGLERLGIFIRDRGSERILMRGTWGTGARGETADERELSHELAPREYQALLGTYLSGGIGCYQPDAPLFALDAGRSVVVGHGWVMATPLVAARDLVGVMYNDTALSHSPMDRGRQAAAAIICTLLAALYPSRRGSINWPQLPRSSRQGPLVASVLRALTEDSSLTGARLARQCGVSAGHLSRAFKRETGLSLVEYRNRLRLDRFFQVTQHHGAGISLLWAALEAGFGSYAQFHRVYRTCLGASPGTVRVRRSAQAREGQAASFLPPAQSLRVLPRVPSKRRR
jgi:AraC-like DNA-binding protein